MEREEFERIIARLQAKDSKALEKLYNAFFKKIYTAALYEVKCRDDAYDIAMDVIMKLCEFHGDASQIRNPVAYIMAVTQYTIKDYFRRKKFMAEANILSLDRSAELGDMLWVKDMLSLLAEDEKDLFLRHAVWGEKLKDIAKLRGKAYITIKRQYSKIKNKLKRFFT